MNVLRSPVFIACICLFLLHQASQKLVGVSIPIVDDYVDSFLAMPVLLTLWLAERKWLLKKKGTQLSVLDISVATLYVAIITEVVFPALSNSFTRDWLDVLCYCAGSAVFYFFINPKEKQEPNHSAPAQQQ